ncbi:histamine H2 receptor-like [Antedon mediterranea]|uniref:histamine H2 receptor-like n=1 Tax=Antedon mediterranea TaxID=105859 RepID=UPI003AF622C5
MDYLMMDENDTGSSSTPGTATEELHDERWLIILRFVLVCIGIVLNTGVIVVFLYIKMYKKSLLHGLIFQQSFLDLFVCCMFLIFYNQDAPDGTRAGRGFCKGRALYWFGVIASIYNLVMITFERYIAVVHPITYRNRNIGGRSNVFYTIPYIIGVLISFHLVVLSEVNKQQKSECVMYTKEFGLLSGILLFVFVFFFPVCFMIFCYCRIVFQIGLRQRSRENRQHAPGLSRKKYVSVKRNLVFTMLIVVVAFIITTAPNFILYLTYAICQCFDFSAMVKNGITILIGTLNMCVNPIIYGAKMEDFKNGVREIWRKLRDANGESSVVDTSQNISSTV